MDAVIDCHRASSFWNPVSGQLPFDFTRCVKYLLFHVFTTGVFNKIFFFFFKTFLSASGAWWIQDANLREAVYLEYFHASLVYIKVPLQFHKHVLPSGVFETLRRDAFELILHSFFRITNN